MVRYASRFLLRAAPFPTTLAAGLWLAAGLAGTTPAAAQANTREQRIIALIGASPHFRQERGLEEEARFVAEVRALFGLSATENIESVDDALRALETALEPRTVAMHVETDPPGMRVEYKRYLFRDDPTVLWTSIRSNTVVSVAAAAYRIRFRPAGGVRDTIVDVPCADGCRVPPR